MFSLLHLESKNYLSLGFLLGEIQSWNIWGFLVRCNSLIRPGNKITFRLPEDIRVSEKDVWVLGWFLVVSVFHFLENLKSVHSVVCSYFYMLRRCVQLLSKLVYNGTESVLPSSPQFTKINTSIFIISAVVPLKSMYFCSFRLTDHPSTYTIGAVLIKQKEKSLLVV